VPAPKELTAPERQKLRTDAQELTRQATVHYNQGRFEEALKLAEHAALICERLYPPDCYPDGHPDRTRSLYNLGQIMTRRGMQCHQQGRFEEALTLAQAALQITRRLYPADRHPDGHADLVASLYNVGFVLFERGAYAQAEPYYRASLTLCRKLYPPGRFPNGHGHLALSLNQLGLLLQERGDYAQAEPLLREALAMRYKLHPAEQFPDGHYELATCLHNLGLLLRVRGAYAEAEAPCSKALAMYRKVYPPAQFPDGHPHLVGSLNNLGTLLRDRGELERAEPYFREALTMSRRLYAPQRFPKGHPHVTLALNNLASLLMQRGKVDEAEALLREALAMDRQLYPPQLYRDGHPSLVSSLTNLAFLLHARGAPAQAEPLCREALSVEQRLIHAQVAGTAEAEALNFLAQLRACQAVYLSVTARLPDRMEEAYGALWHRKGVIAHLLRQRRAAVLLAEDKTSRELARELASVRQALAGLLRPDISLGPGPADGARALGAKKEQLERQLAERLPLYRAMQERLRRSPADLLHCLPPGTVLLDLAWYQRAEQDPKVPGAAGERWTLCYVAFVLAKGEPIRRVELGAAAPIDAALGVWRRSLQAGQAVSPAADTLRRRLWRPLEESFPAGTRTVVVAPDGALTWLPWAALPGREPGRLLLEEYALAVVPDGQFLLDLLLASPSKGKQDVLLAAGGIDYDQPAAAAPAPPAEGLARAPQPAKERPFWSALPATAQELAQVERLAGKRTVVKRQGSAASSGQLLADLPQARWAHLATHGFFADPSVRSVFQLSPEDYKRSQKGERIGLGARSPLVLSGLVCAGANRPVNDPEKDDGGILTAEAIAGLSLDGLELAVLSACETGLGESGGGEGVFGLQRAFHIAGARTVVASLWKIDDAATQALMQEFYRNLWERKLPKLEALRRAQLAMLLHYDAKAGRLRAPGAAVPVDPAELAAAREKLRTAGRPPLPPLYWAGFVLSGDWR
jgi:CHAT domain-containing protein